jgi:hypothetical protein
MTGNVAVEPQSTEPAVRQIEVDFLAQPTLRTNAVAVAVADNQHAHHQLGINRGPPDVAIVGPQVRPNLGQVDEPVDLSQQMIIGNAPLESEAVKQCLPLTRRSPIIDRISRTQQKRISARASIKQSFSTQFAHGRLSVKVARDLQTGQTIEGYPTVRSALRPFGATLLRQVSLPQSSQLAVL